MRLTDITVKALPPPASGQRLYMDDAVQGFGVRVSAGGTKTWVVVHGANRQKTTIGRYPLIALKDARAAAKRVLAEFTLGRQRSPRMRFSEAMELFLEQHCKPNNRDSTYKTTKGLLRKHFLPPLRNTQLSELTADDVIRVTDRLLKQQYPGAANHAFTAIRTMLRFCVRRRLILHSPIEGMGLPARTRSRSRVLHPEELKRVWHAAEEYGYPFGQIVRLLILTGQRRIEIGSLRADWIDHEAQIIAFPPEIAKNGRSHTLPFGSMAAAVLADLPHSDGILFRARGKKTPFVGWSKSKELLDKAMDPPLSPWVLHDLRRTFSTMHASLGTPPHITERMLNHRTGTISGVAAIYNRFEYLDEMREAAESWEAHLSRLLAS